MKRRIASAVAVIGVAVAGLVTIGPAKAHLGHKLSVTDASVTEGGALDFTVTVSPAPLQGEKITVDVSAGSFFGGTASSSDFTNPGTKTLNFTYTIFGPISSLKYSVPTAQDTLDEPNETMRVTLSNATASASGSCGGYFCLASAEISDGTGIGTIVDDDTAANPNPNPNPDPNPNPNPTQPALSVLDHPGASKQNDCVFTVILDRAPTTAVGVNWSLSGATTQIAGPTSGRLTFNPGDSLRQLTVDVIKQTRRNANVDIVLSGAQGATITDGNATCTINKKKRQRR